MTFSFPLPFPPIVLASPSNTRLVPGLTVFVDVDAHALWPIGRTARLQAAIAVLGSLDIIGMLLALTLRLFAATLA